jgi:hypothetical protein
MVVPMSRTMLTRIAKLEATRPRAQGDGSIAVLWSHHGTSVQQQKAALIAAGRDFIEIRFVRPGEGHSR